MSTRTDADIRASVAESYGNRVRRILDAQTEVPLVSNDACCAPASTATATPTAADPCCAMPAGSSTEPKGDACCATPDLDAIDAQITGIERLYKGTDVSDLPTSVTDVAFGCGNPTAIEALKPGQVVLDLGSGGGIDCFLAAKMVGETGKVFGVDMTQEMISLSRRNAQKVGATNVEFRLGEIEHLPIEAGTVDVIISNCVINLSPDKDQVFRESFRVLKPGGKLQVSDIVWTQPAPEAIKDDIEQWAGCIAGALLESDYLGKIKAAGFVDVTSTAAEYPGGRGLASAAVVAIKPAT